MKKGIYLYNKIETYKTIYNIFMRLKNALNKKNSAFPVHSNLVWAWLAI